MIYALSGNVCKYFIAYSLIIIELMCFRLSIIAAVTTFEYLI